MAMETLISLQSAGLRSIGEPTAPRPSGVQQGSVVVVLDVNKGVAPAAVYWTLGNVVRKGDHLKILGIITHLSNPMGFMVRVDQPTRNSPNIMELQFEIATKKEAIWRTAFLKEWCEKAGVKLEVDVKAGNNPKVIASDEAKAMGAYHVILDKNMKKDRKYFIDNLSCFVSRIRSSGGVDTLRSFAMSSKLPPMAPTTPKKLAANNNTNSESAARHRSKGSTASSSGSSYHGGSSMSSTSFELGGESSDDIFSAQEGDPVSIPNMDLPQSGPPQQLTIRINPQPPNQLYNLLIGPVIDVENNKNVGFNLNNNPLRKLPAVRNWLNEDHDRISNVSSEIDDQQPGPLTPRTEFRFEQGPVQRLIRQGPATMGNNNGWIGQLNVAPEFTGPGKMGMGRPVLTATLLQTQASFNKNQRKKFFRPDNNTISMDVHWPVMHWADCRAMKLRSQHASSAAMISSSSNSSLNNFRGRRPRMPVSSLNYSDMVDSD